MRRLVPIATLLAIACWLTIGALPSVASRFGPPWQARVVADQTLVRAEPDSASAVIGPLTRGTIVVVTGERTAADRHEWTSTTLGWLPSEDIAEIFEPWVADVIVDSTPVYSKPNARDAIRMHASKGDLLRVAGVSPGMNGDHHVWWSTTEGYVLID